MQEIEVLIANVGFPIAVCLLCMFYIYRQSILHKEEMEKITDALNNNTLAVTTLRDTIEYLTPKAGVINVSRET